MMIINGRPVDRHFIALEGIDGIGKTHQAGRLAETLRSLYPDRNIRTLREPGTTAVGESIRAILEEHRSGMDPMTELFLYAAARRHLVSESLTGWLKAGDIVVADRFTGSTLAYQGTALRTHPRYKDAMESQLDEILDDICALATDGWIANPALNILYVPDCDDEGFGAIINRKQQTPLSPAQLEYLESVNERYIAIAEANPETWTVIGVAADQSADSVAGETLAVVLEHLREVGLPKPAPRAETLE